VRPSQNFCPKEDPRHESRSDPSSYQAKFKEGIICDAFLAATADYLSRINAILTPAWAFGQNRALEIPWFCDESKEFRLMLLPDTPSAFKDKNLFILPLCLERGLNYLPVGRRRLLCTSTTPGMERVICSARSLAA
jgi:hypothetical protein